MAIWDIKLLMITKKTNQDYDIVQMSEQDAIPKEGHLYQLQVQLRAQSTH